MTTATELAEAYAQHGNFSVNDFLSWAKIGRTKFYQEVKEGRIKVHKIGSRSVIRMPDALTWLNSLPESA